MPSLFLRLLAHTPACFDGWLPPNLDNRPKVFGIGFHKTGTTSLGRALRALGFRVHRGFTFNRPGKRIAIAEPVTPDKIRPVAFGKIPYYSAFEDNPWPLLFKELDQAYPGSKFILTRRDPEAWYRSAARFHEGRPSPMLDLVYGAPNFCIASNRQIALQRFNAHNEEVCRHFKDRPEALLDWNLEAEPRWDKLCDFLELPVPHARPFPHGKKQSPA
jgi:hypothetical protein